MGGHHHTGRRSQRGGAAESPEGAFFQHLEQSRLHVGAQFCDLVEKHGPFTGHFQQTALGNAGICEGTSLVSEHLAFKKGTRQGRAVDFHKRGRAAHRTVVNLAGDKALAGARLTLQEHRRLGVSRRQVDEIGDGGGHGRRGGLGASLRA